MKKILLFSFIFLFSFTTTIFAQGSSLGGVEEQFSVELSTRYPAPEEIISSTVRSFSSDFNRATITWSVNGQIIISQIGATNFSFQAGKAGETTRLKVSIRKQEDGKVLEKEFTFRPSSVDLIVEPQTTSTPLFQGKPYLSTQSALKVFAIPNLRDNQGNLIPSNRLVYRWTKDGRVDEARSGYGKDYYYFGSSMITRPFNLRVEAYDVNSPARATSSTNIVYRDPSIFFYEKNPIFGTLFNKAIQGRFFLERKEVEFEAVPYAFSKGSIPNYEWVMNGNSVSTPLNRQLMTFVNENNESGTANISLSVTVSEKILQNALGSFSLLFGDNILNN
jgi:hypothetical protein